MSSRGARRALAAGVLCALGVAAGGGSCAPTIIATAGISALQFGTAAWANGELEAAYMVPIAQMRQITIDSLGELRFPIVYDQVRERNDYVVARELSGRKITIFLEKRSEVVTKVNIRVGVWGDQAISRLILGEIQARCPALPGVEPGSRTPMVAR